MKTGGENILRRVAMAALWVAVGAYVCFGASSSVGERRQRRVSRVEIVAADSAADGFLATESTVRRWIERSRIATVGQPVDSVDLAGIERAVAANGCIDRVRAYVGYDGVLTVEVRRRRPVVRLLVDGYDCYADRDGNVFPAPAGSSLYLPVVTGSYRPPFAGGFKGNIHAEAARLRARSEAFRDSLEKQKYPHKRIRSQWRDSLRKYARRYTSQRFFESEQAFARRVEALKSENARRRVRYEYLAGIEQQAVDRIADRQRQEDETQKKLQKNYEDFGKLITFVRRLEKDDFWSAETVQIVASTNSAGELETVLVPRSGDFVIEFGRIDSPKENDEKLDRLREFYRKVLDRTGANEYRTINIKYKGQVVCAKR